MKLLQVRITVFPLLDHFRTIWHYEPLKINRNNVKFDEAAGKEILSVHSSTFKVEEWTAISTFSLIAKLFLNQM